MANSKAEDSPEMPSWAIKWWARNIQNLSAPIRYPKPDYTIYTDASRQVWGCYDPYLHKGGGGGYGILMKSFTR